MKVYTILSPQLFPLFENDLSDKQVLVIDILRATTSMVVMLENGANKVCPVDAVDKALKLKETNACWLIAGERNGFRVEGFDFGNSPQEFSRVRVANKNVVITTTNGTQALVLSESAAQIWVGSFLNLDAAVKAVQNAKNDVYLFCAGWKGHFNMEDTVFAGAVAEQLLEGGAILDDDASRAAVALWQSAKANLAEFLSNASHVQRFRSMHDESDLDVCLQMNTSKKAVRYENGELVAIPS